MGDCCGSHNKIDPTQACSQSQSACCADTNSEAGTNGPLAWFAQSMAHCLDHAKKAKAQGRPIVGIMCEYTPRELIMAAGGVPVCLCGGSEATIGTAEAELPACLCPLIKSTYGFHLEKSNPFLEMADLLVGETTCDGKKKMYELMARSRPMHVLELPQKPDDEDALNHWVRELHKFKAVLEERFNTTITDEKLREAIATMNRERHLRRSIAGLMTKDNPPLTGRQLLQLKSSISGISCDFAQYEKVLEQLSDTSPETDLSSRVRVLLTGVPVVEGSERVVDMIESSDGLIVCMENCTGLKPVMQDVDDSEPDLIRSLAKKYFHLPCSVMTLNDRRLDLLRDLKEQYRPQCVIELIWQGCLTYDVESVRVRELVEKQLGLPYLRIVTDYSPADSSRIAVRVEALFETVKSRALTRLS